METFECLHHRSARDHDRHLATIVHRAVYIRDQVQFVSRVAGRLRDGRLVKLFPMRAASAALARVVRLAALVMVSTHILSRI